MSEPEEPIVYYMDAGIPEPYRTAFREGAEWWKTVFEAAGFRNAFRVEDMPPDMDPMDARYHVIQWVHRLSPGSSIGPSIVDPRTGEIIKAAVRMDSYRSMMDYDIYAGARPVLGMGGGSDDLWLADLDPAVTGEEFAMARRRQHAGHEVGHTLGLAHNFVATSYGRASVMDYPAPLIELRGTSVDLSNAYRPGPGAWDSLAIRYGYTEFAGGTEDTALEAIVEEGIARGLRFVTNPDEDESSSFPEATTWVNGAEMVAELERVSQLRRFLIDNFDESAIAEGEPMALLTQRFTRVYLSHRFTLIGATKAIGGMSFRYAVRGDGLPPTEMVDPQRQRLALGRVLDAIEPDDLAIPERVLKLMAPRPFGFPSSELALRSAMGPAFDQLGAARTLADAIVGGLLDPERLGRVAAFAARDRTAPALDEVIGTIVDRTWSPEPRGPHAALRRAVQRVVVDGLIDLAADAEASVEVRAAAEWALDNIGRVAAERGPLDGSDAAHLALVTADIDRFMSRPYEPTERSRPRGMPDGTPIGRR